MLCFLKDEKYNPYSPPTGRAGYFEKLVARSQTHLRSTHSQHLLLSLKFQKLQRKTQVELYSSNIQPFLWPLLSSISSHRCLMADDMTSKESFLQVVKKIFPEQKNSHCSRESTPLKGNYFWRTDSSILNIVHKTSDCEGKKNQYIYRYVPMPLGVIPLRSWGFTTQ